MPAGEKNIYLSFDDGPHPEITPFVLEELKKNNAKATFFCVGSNVARYPNVYRQILQDGHAIGNHTYSHPNGWETSTKEYLDEVAMTSKFIETNLFRPPYGRIKKQQARGLNEAMNIRNVKVIMWDVLSLDFDTTYSPSQCLDNVMKNSTDGSIVVFHDSEKAFPNLKHSFPKAIKALAEEGYSFKKIELL